MGSVQDPAWHLAGANSDGSLHGSRAQSWGNSSESDGVRLPGSKRPVRDLSGPRNASPRKGPPRLHPRIPMETLCAHREADPRAFGWLVGYVDGAGRCSLLASIRCVAVNDGVVDWSREPGPPAELLPCGLSVIGVYVGCDGASPAIEQLIYLLTPHAAALRAACRTGSASPVVAAVSAGEAVAFFEVSALSPLELRSVELGRENALADFASTHVALRARPTLHLQARLAYHLSHS